MKLPIIKLLKKRAYRELAAFQDDAVDILYQVDSSVIMHGGTAIWRCYGGSRFSNDIDIYLASKKRLGKIKGAIQEAASSRNISLEKVKDTGNLVFIGLALDDVYLKVEINYRTAGLRPIAVRFEKVDGTYTEILSLSADDLILEKILAYKDRRFIRDIYDIYVLSSYVSDEEKVKKALLEFLDGIKPPINEEDLKTLVYTGPIPSFENIVKYIRGKFA